MTAWRTRLKLKHLLTEEEDLESVQESMNKIAGVLETCSYFDTFDTNRFRNIPAGDDVITPKDYANKLLSWMYDWADEKLVWIE